MNFLKKNQPGFSLLTDILVAAGIIALLSATSIPFIGRYQPTLKLSSAAKQLSGDLRYAQQLTITEQINHILRLDLIQKSYQITKEDGLIKSVQLENGISFSASTTATSVEFNPYGAVTGSSTGQIVLQNDSGKTAVINVKPSGYIQLVQ